MIDEKQQLKAELVENENKNISDVQKKK